MNLANRLKSRRTDLKLTQKELADFAGTTQQSIQRIEDGTIRKPRNLLELAKALSCSAEWLQSGTALSYDNVSQGPESMRRVTERLSIIDRSLAWLARELGKEPQVLNNWKKRGVPASQTLNVSRVLGVSREWIETGIDEISNLSSDPENGGEPPMSTLEVCVSSLEKDVKEIKADIKDINKSINDQTKWMSDKIESMYDKIESQTKWMVGLALTIPSAFIAIDQLLNFLNK